MVEYYSDCSEQALQSYIDQIFALITIAKNVKRGSVGEDLTLNLYTIWHCRKLNWKIL